MAMEIVVARPPLYDEIVAVFPVVRGFTGVYFSWGRKIYNPDGVEIPPHIMCHEAVHGQRQLAFLRDQGPDLAGGPFGLSQAHDEEESIRAWWRRYLADPKWRYAEELVAHRAEYSAFVSTCRDRKLREFVLAECAKRLSSLMYGNLVTYAQARREIRG